jgi:HAD superfamily hydrolase (TIGR01509 family)
VKNFQEHPQSILFTDSIRPVLQQLHPTEDYCIGQDSGIYWRIVDPPERSAEAPDWMAWQTAIVELGYTISDELYLTFIGRKDTECEAILQQLWGDAFPITQCRQRIAQLWQHHVQTQGIARKPGLSELLTYLEEKSIVKAVATSTERQQALHRLDDLANRFAASVTRDEVLQCKPAPDIFLLAADRLQVAPENGLVLEDSEAGIAAAQAAGMTAIMVPDLETTEGGDGYRSRGDRGGSDCVGTKIPG